MLLYWWSSFTSAHMSVDSTALSAPIAKITQINMLVCSIAQPLRRSHIVSDQQRVFSARSDSEHSLHSLPRRASTSFRIGPAHATIERSRDLNGVRPSQGLYVPPRRTSTHPRSATPPASVSAKMPNSVQALRYAIHRYSELFNIAGERERRACGSLALGRTPRCDGDVVAQFARTRQVVLKAAVTKVPARVSREVEMSVPAALALSFYLLLSTLYGL